VNNLSQRDVGGRRVEWAISEQKQRKEEEMKYAIRNMFEARIDTDLTSVSLSFGLLFPSDR